jgi:hypothetical protein
MYSRTVASMVLLITLLSGTVSPMAVCVLMCDRHLRADVHHHCGQDSDPMPRMAHHQSAVHHCAVGKMTLVVQAQSCQTDCAAAERVNIPRKVVPQVTVVQTGGIVLGTTSKLLAPHLESACSLDSGPPFLPSAYTGSYSILRI